MGGVDGGLFVAQSLIIGASLLAYMPCGKLCRRDSVLATSDLDFE